MNRCLRLGFLLFVLGALPSFAQSPSTGAQLSGTISDPQGAAVPGASVKLRSESSGIERVTISGISGEYRFLLVPAGQYTLSVEAPGFAKMTDTGVVLTVGKIANLPLTLRLAGASAEVMVTADAELVETQRTSVSTTVDQTRIDNLPINGRNYINFALTNAQVARDTAPSIGAAPTSGLNVGGQRARANLVNVDGEDATDNSTNGVRSTVSQEAVQEFQLITNGYAPEYGRAAGGVVNIVTRSGANDLHGTAFAYLRNRNIQAVNPFSTVGNPAYTRVQSGFTLSGPLKRDQTFYFLSFESTRRHETGFSSIGAQNFGLTPLSLPGLGTFQVTPAQAQFIGANAAALTLSPSNPLYQFVSSYLFLAGASSAVATNGVQPAAFGGRAGFASSCNPTTPVCAPMPASFVALNSVRGNFPVFEGTSIYSLRLDHHFDTRHQLMLRGSASPSTVTGIQVNAQGPAENFGQNAFSRTSQQTFRDAGITAQYQWTLGQNKVNEARFQYARRGLLYNFSPDSTGGNVAVNIPGFAFLGREPFSYVRRTEQRYQFTDNFSWLHGRHTVKFGADVNHLPLQADFTVNFGGVYNFGELSPSSFGLPVAFNGQTVPTFSPVQAYGLGIPQAFIQGIGNPHDEFANNTLGLFVQDSWRLKPSLTLNYGLRYDVEFTPVFPAVTDIAQKAQDALGIAKGVPRDTNNFAPRIGLAWDPGKDGKTVVRSSFGLFYDHPLLALIFDSDVADGARAPQLAFTGGAPAPCTSPTAAVANLNATNIFQGLLGCLPASFGYLPNEQRFNALLPNSIFVNENYLGAGIPLSILPFGFSTGKKFEFAYSEQANLSVEHDFGNDFALDLSYNFNGGHHQNRPLDVNPPVYSALISNWQAAMSDPNLTPAQKADFATNPLLVDQFGFSPTQGPYVPAAVTNFFRRSGVNPTYCGANTNGTSCTGNVLPPQAQALVSAVEARYGLGLGVPIPFAGMTPNVSIGNSVYHGLTANLRKRFSRNWEMLASYTWSHAIDDSTDLQTPLSPQDNFRPSLERSNSLFDQRHRFVWSGVFQSGRFLDGSGISGKLLSNWTVAPIIEFSSGRPFEILTGADTNFDFGSNTDRPNVVPAGAKTDSCGNVPVASKYSPTGFLQAACFIDGTVPGNLGRNAGIRPGTVFTDLRVSRRIGLGERVMLNGIMDVFNVANRSNVADVNPLYTQAGAPTAAFDPRQLQFALKLSW
jgi:Carboxypeptidase regulatory-like domain/TonB dependent receptor-like, beta-barrel